jgi:23S rRNA (uridine2552-2'-O)-methyltransferase
MPYKPNDHYARKAKSENYLARSVYKLKEIDDKYRILAPRQKVLDLGASPGSWSQYASERIGHQGSVLGLDLTPIPLRLPNATFLEADIMTYDFESSSCPVSPPYDVVLSDMAPKTTGVKSLDQARSALLCEMALQVAVRYLKPGGHFVCKMFDGPDFQAFRTEAQAVFTKLATVRPDSTRSMSKELFWVGLIKKSTNGE